jgi:Zn-dependent membrane protease YugP
MLLFLVLIIGTFAISGWAAMRVKSNYLRFSKVPASSGYTGAQAAAEILRSAGISDVQIYEHQEMLGDHYDPIHKRLVLSSDNYHGTSLAALGVAAHEAGHALQHKAAYAPLQMRMAAVGITTYANQVVMWLPIIGMFTGLIHGRTALLLMAIAWGVIMLFNLVTLPVEFDASRRAKLILDRMGFIRGQSEMDGVNRVLNAAAWTYVAAFITSLAYFLWHLLPLLLGGRRSD